MGLNKYNIVKWYKMLTGKSILHVNQGAGKVYSKDEIKGYYNDLTEKVTRDKNFNDVVLPKLITETGREIIFPISVFQYGLGSYDLYIIENKSLYLEKFKLMVDWAVDNQDENGAWNTFFYIYPNSPYSAMAQGEGASLLMRAFMEYGDERYKASAKRAIDFMLKSIDDGGTTSYDDSDVIFKEYTHKPVVLNGWIFAIFGLYDYVKLTEDETKKEILKATLKSLEKHMTDFDNGYWSMYDNHNIIASPFYHDLHLAQLEVIYDLFGIEKIKFFHGRWEQFRNKRINKGIAFSVKVFQKIREK